MASPYYQYAGVPQRYVFDWNGGQGGVLPSASQRGNRQLGAADLLESGYTDPTFEPFPATQKYARCAATVQKPCALRAKAAAQLAGVGDWPLVRPAGFEPEAMGLFGTMSDNEKRLALIAGAGVLAWWLYKRSKKGRRRNPSRKNPWAVISTTRGVTGSLVFRRRKDAEAYAAERRSGKKPKRARVVPYTLRRYRRKRR